MATPEAAGHAAGDRVGGTETVPARIPALDVLRGVAVMGILIINISVFALPPGAQVVPNDPAAAQVADFYVWMVNEIFVEGTMRGLFSMLFGASMLLMTGIVVAQGPASGFPAHGRVQSIDLYARRSLWLVIFGLVHAYVLLWPYDILYAYGLLGLLLLPLRVLAVRQLLLVGLFMLAIGVLVPALKAPDPGSLYDLSGYGLSNRNDGDLFFRPLPDGLADVTPPKDEIRLSAAEAETRDAIDTRRSGYWDNFHDMAGKTALLQSEGLYRISVFDIGGMMLIGMALLRAGVLTGRRSRRFYWLMLVSGYGIGLMVNGVETWVSVMSPPDSAKLVYWPKVTYDLGRLPMALGHVAVLMLLMKLPLFEFPARLLSAAGRLALTNYITQTVICNTLFLGVGFGLYGAFRLHQLMILALTICIFQVAFSVIWLQRYRIGPVEWALRSLVRWSPQPLRRQAPEGVPTVAAAAGP